ncbi:unnamed protein product [Miscanthus lutarioriparius]|uniref:MADS-box domain-containing protein n=1 Tax=Miscanthus lutarioriparius TaxID=422564 RepID=A0A811PX70_9POAL|nr:unnamed protein product [Miscanthus lutarioriparius]
MQVTAASSASMASEAEMVVEAGGGGERKRKKTLGRRKIDIKPIKCMEVRHVCFSKRREGLNKKASELCALTGAKVAVIVYSPAGKPYSFGHPSVSAVVERYLDLDPVSSAAANDAFEAPPPPMMYEFDGQRDRLCESIAAEVRWKDALDAAARAAGVWTDDVVRQAEMGELVAMLTALERVKDDADHAMRQHQCAAAAAAAAGACYYDLGDGTSFAADDYGGASSSSSHHQQLAVDAQTMALLMGGNVVGHAATHAPMLLPPPDLPPAAAPVPLAFNYGSDHSHVTGYEGYAYDLGDGGGHGSAYETEAGCYFGPTATCNFFG